MKGFIKKGTVTMEITIKGESKEIAALVLSVQERRKPVDDIRKDEVLRFLNDSMSKSVLPHLLV